MKSRTLISSHCRQFCKAVMLTKTETDGFGSLFPSVINSGEPAVVNLNSSHKITYLGEDDRQ